jgi:hypothetical protein
VEFGKVALQNFNDWGYISSMTVTLPAELEKFIAEQIESGHYHFIHAPLGSASPQGACSAGKRSRSATPSTSGGSRGSTRRPVPSPGDYFNRLL